MEQNVPVAWGILATGKIAGSFARDLRHVPGARIAAVGSRREESARAFAAEHGGRAHASYEALVSDPEVDVVYVASPHALHLEHARMAMYVYVQKPADFQRWLRAEAAAARAPSSAASRAGRDAFFANQCASCHTIRGTPARGVVGPDLTHVGSRSSIAALTLPNTRAALTDWLRDPQHAKPGNRMPDLDLSRAELRSLVAYLEGLR